MVDLAPASPDAALDGAVSARERPPLYHFTCIHGAVPLVACGAVVPSPHPLLPRVLPLAWLTSDPHPNPEALGFTAGADAPCDRTECRFLVIDSSHCVAWWEVVDRIPTFALPANVLWLLENGRDTGRWWVSHVPVPVVLA